MIKIEIHGTGTHNRGAELMAIAIKSKVQQRDPGAVLAVAPGFGSREARRRHGFSTTWAYEGSRRTIPLALTRFLPGPMRELAGTRDPAAFDAVLDASGFAFSDQWGPMFASRLAEKMLKPHRRHQKLVLLPQALGPFADDRVADACRRLFERATLIFARDRTSLAAVHGLGFANAELSPDFTVGLKGDGVARAEREFVAIVPNLRMLDKSETASDYLSFLTGCISQCKSMGLDPLFVLHDAREDAQVVQRLGETASRIPVFTSSDPLVLKSILGNAKFVIASRYHAIVSALSQGVPCACAGWSHKYPELLADFDVPELLVHNLADKATVTHLFSLLTDPTSFNELRSRLLTSCERIKLLNDSMWDRVFRCLES